MTGVPYEIADWKSAVAAKRQELYESIPPSHRLPAALADRATKGTLQPEDPEVLQCGILNDRDLEITNFTDAVALASTIWTGKYTSVQVTEAFCKRASIAQQCTNCLSAVFYDAAIQKARELDDHLMRTGRPIGILHGLPVSVKDVFNVKGQATTGGLVSWLPNIASNNATVVDGIVAAGGIPYAKTATSQACLMVESITNVFGTVRNPYNPQLSAGGSSGGEAALVAAKGSILGSGTDGGGSIRFPAMFCGLWALKCSQGRIPTGNCAGGPRSGSESVNMGVGPMARSVASLELWMKAQLDSKPWDIDSSCIPMSWNVPEAERPQKALTIAVLWDDGIVKPVPPVTRAVHKIANLLRQHGHRVIDLPQDRIQSIHRQAMSCTMRSNVQDGGETVMKHIEASGEPVVPRTATGSPASRLTAREIFDNHILRSRLINQYDELWKSYQIDAILAPAVCHPAPPHGRYISNSYATVYNMLDYVTGSIPFSTVDAVLDEANREWYNRLPYDQIEPERFPYDLGDKDMIDLYTSPDVFENAPSGVQLVCRKLREEKCIGILKEIEALIPLAQG